VRRACGGHRRREPPLRELLLRLREPRELAARSDFPLEYPENASDFVPLRSAADVVRLPLPLLCPRDSWLVPLARLVCVALDVEALGVELVLLLRRCCACAVAPLSWRFC
jgi:hypothetical protein